MFFGSDNGAGVLPEIMTALAKANEYFAGGYGNDALTQAVEEQMNVLFGRKVTTFLVGTGTAANALALACLSPSWGMVLAHEEAHVNQDECGAPEFFGNGLKLWPLRGIGAKLDAETVADTCRRMPQRVPHSTPLKALTISQTTECGLIYTPAEVKAIADICHGHGLMLHMDGARFGNAVAALGCSPADITWKAGVDALSFGATKGGAMGVEAVVLFDDGKAEEFIWRRKRAGHLFSKHRFLAAQMRAYLDRDLWLDSARHANAMAAMLTGGLAANGFATAWPVEANSLFPLLPRSVAQRLQAAGVVFYEWPSRAFAAGHAPKQGEMLARLITSFATTESMVERFLAASR